MIYGVVFAVVLVFYVRFLVRDYQSSHEIDWWSIIQIGLWLMMLYILITGHGLKKEEKVIDTRYYLPTPSTLWERITTFATSRAATRALAYLILILFVGYMVYTGYMHRHYNFIPSRDPARYLNAVLTFCIAALFVIYFLPARRQ